MKKFIIVPIMIVVLLVVSSHQAASQLRFGIQCGANFSNLTYFPILYTHTRDEIYYGRTGIVVSVVAESELSDLFSMQSGFQYAQKGMTQVFTSQPDVIFDGTYLELPLLLKAKFTLPVVRPYIIAGVAVCYNVTASLIFTDSNPNDPLIRDVRNRIRLLEMTLLGGVGVEIPLRSNLSLIVDGRYSFGVTSLAEGAATRDIRISIGVLWEW